MHDAGSEESETEQLAPRDVPLLPWWQIHLVLIGVPLCYWANGFMPWSYGLFVKGDHAYFVPFGLSICVLHWVSLLFTLWLVRRAGGSIRSIGLDARWTSIVPLTLGLLLAGGLLVGLRYTWPVDAAPPNDWRALYPFTFLERCFFVLMSFSAGFCEEVIYRGFAITMLKRRGWGTWAAVGLAMLSFVFMHGIAALFLFPLLISAGILYGALFLWRDDLTLCIVLHTLFDQMSILAI
jgi:membrane protease YdiL (CAAX protease family)